jgi:16S rRNA (adenine1518-N6/adenine1519-N6)-dimethyltransferase
MSSDLNTPKKSLGQHWLSDLQVLSDIVESANLTKEDTVLEIGPGLGTLTKLLTEKARKVVAVEKDEALVQKLAHTIAKSNLEVVNQDILRYDLTTLPAGYKVVANIPYYLTSNLIRTLSESTNPPSRVVLLVQKEVAERVAARPGSMSLLSVTAQFYWQVSLGQVVLAELFTPPPKVDSQVLILTWRPEPLFSEVDTPAFFRLVKAGFSQRRKTLLNSLSAGLSLSREAAEILLQTAKLDSQARPQTLSLEDWYALYRVFTATPQSA